MKVAGARKGKNSEVYMIRMSLISNVGGFLVPYYVAK